MSTINEQFDFSKLEEPVTIERHEPRWARWYAEEVAHLAPIFGTALIAFEHVGSSAIAGLLSKPIVDILVGLRDFSISGGTISALKARGYEYFGRLHTDQQRLFARHRGERSFNLQIVAHASSDWIERVAFREYLRAHPDCIRAYSLVKSEALAVGKSGLQDYHMHKHQVVEKLSRAALKWFSEQNKQ